jgi:hypothetical protein
MQGLAALGYSAALRARFADSKAATRRAVAIAREDEKAYRLTAALSLLAAELALQGRSSESGRCLSRPDRRTRRSGTPSWSRSPSPMPPRPYASWPVPDGARTWPGHTASWARRWTRPAAPGPSPSWNRRPRSSPNAALPGAGTGRSRPCGGTHISEDQLILEPVDLAGRTVPPGERSAKVYLTNLYNPVLPLTHLFRTALSREADVVEYQVRQTPVGAAIAIRCTAPVSVDGLRNRVATALARAGLDRTQVTVEVVDWFERPGGPAKLKRFLALDRVPAPSNTGR